MAASKDTSGLVEDPAPVAPRRSDPDGHTLLEREPALVAMLADAERKVEAVLEAMPEAFIDARRLIGRELWPLPRPEELQVIIKIAADHEAEGPRREVPRRFIALRLVAEELTRAYWDPMLLDPGAIWCRAQDLQTIVEAVARLEGRLEPGPGSAADVAFEDRVYLKTVAHALCPRRDVIGAAITLAHPLVEIMEVAGADDVRERIPTLTGEEFGVLRRITGAGEADPRDGAPTSGIDGIDDLTSDAASGATGDTHEEGSEDPGSDPARLHVVLEVLTVRWLIHGDVAEWEELFREAEELQEGEARPGAPAAEEAQTHDLPSASPAAGSPPSPAPASAVDGPRDEDEIWVIGEDESGEADEARASEEAPQANATSEVAGSSPDPSEGERERRPLLLTHEQIERRTLIHRRALEHQILYGVVSERLQKLQDEALLARQKATTEWLAAFRRPLVASYSKLLTVARNQVPGATAPGMAYVPKDEPAETYEHVFEKAVTHVEEQQAEDEAAKSATPERKQRKRRLRRIILMAASIVVLSLVAVAVRFLLPDPPPKVLLFSPSEARNVISLSETRPIGAMLYAKLQGQWDAFSDTEREREVVSLARIVSERGFTSIYLVDDAGEPLAQWDPMHGPRLFARPQPQ